MNCPNSRQGFSILSLVIVLLFTGLMVWVLTKVTQSTSHNSSMMKHANIDTSSYKSIIDSARRVADDASKPRQ